VWITGLGEVKRVSEKTIIVLGAKGGVGTSTVALNLAVQAAQLTQKRVALLEYARPFGQIALMLDLRPRFTLMDALERAGRLDERVLESLTEKHKSGVDILAGPMHAALRDEQRPHVTLEGFVKILELARSAYDYLVVDLGFVNAAEWARLLQMAEHLLLVAEPSALAMGMLERYLKASASAGIGAEHFQVVMNRWRQNDEEFASRRTGAGAVAGAGAARNFLARLPNDYRQVSEAVTFGTPIAGSSNNLLYARYRKMAGDLLGLRGAEQVRGVEAGAPVVSA
jgi:pilus assembly protein CpaE